MWIIGQIAVDILMLILLVAVVKFHLKQRISLERFEAAAQESELLLSQMRQISDTLEKNLDHKRELTRHLLGELDKRLNKAEKASVELHSILNRSHQYLASGLNRRPDSDTSKESIRILLDKGLSKDEISKRLGIPVAELELILKLQSPVDKVGTTTNSF